LEGKSSQRIGKNILQPQKHMRKKSSLGTGRKNKALSPFPGSWAFIPASLLGALSNSEGQEEVRSRLPGYFLRHTPLEGCPAAKPPPNKGRNMHDSQEEKDRAVLRHGFRLHPWDTSILSRTGREEELYQAVGAQGQGFKKPTAASARHLPSSGEERN
jgi:hypothetical protein